VIPVSAALQDSLLALGIVVAFAAILFDKHGQLVLLGALFFAVLELVRMFGFSPLMIAGLLTIAGLIKVVVGGLLDGGGEENVALVKLVDGLLSDSGEPSRPPQRQGGQQQIWNDNDD
jgi:hypothetical protein